jgi:hypothetical protein
MPVPQMVTARGPGTKFHRSYPLMGRHGHVSAAGIGKLSVHNNAEVRL